MNIRKNSIASSENTGFSGVSPDGENTGSDEGNAGSFAEPLLSAAQAARLDTLAELMNYTCHFVHHYSGKRGQGKILGLLSREGPITQHEMQNRLHIQSGSLSEILTKLENAGFITRQRDTADKRRQIISITEAGQADLDEHRARRLHRQRLLFTNLTDDEQEELIRILHKLHKSWEELPTQGQPDGCNCQKSADTDNRQHAADTGGDQSSADTDPGQNWEVQKT